MAASGPRAGVSVLSFHAAYLCRHTGACCTAGWPIAIDHDALQQIDAAVSRGRVSARLRPHAVWLPPAETTIDSAGLLRHDANGCAFYDPAHPRHCSVHRALGHEALPLACRQFPRVVVQDARGTFVTLSHFCPTAASLLDEDPGVPVSICTAAERFPPSAEYVGLDARTALPPLLRPDMCFDWEAWSRWEARAVAWLDRAGGTPAEAIASLGAAAETLRDWSPADGPLVAAVDRAFAGVHVRRYARVNPDHQVADVTGTVAAELRTPVAGSPARVADRAARRFLAAHAFANWTAYLAEDLRAWVRSIDAALAFLDVGCSVREADRWLRHLADPYALARLWSGRATSR
jgi:hypothetical protein